MIPADAIFCYMGLWRIVKEEYLLKTALVVHLEESIEASHCKTCDRFTGNGPKFILGNKYFSFYFSVCQICQFCFGLGKIGIKCFSRILLVAYERRSPKPHFYGPIKWQ